jgi:hypothetical protein
MLLYLERPAGAAYMRLLVSQIYRSICRFALCSPISYNWASNLPKLLCWQHVSSWLVRFFSKSMLTLRKSLLCLVCFVIKVWRDWLYAVLSFFPSRKGGQSRSGIFAGQDSEDRKMKMRAICYGRFYAFRPWCTSKDFCQHCDVHCIYQVGCIYPLNSVFHHLFTSLHSHCEIY